MKIGAMFPIEESEEWVFQDLIMDDASLERSKKYSTKRVGKRQQKLVAIPEENDDETTVANDNKQKAAHKEIERKRRQEMGNLHASLRSLLPLDYIKGKRSMSDHIHESVNYIKHMQKTIEELKIKREALHMVSNSNTSSSTSSNCFPISITVGLCLRGLEILINSSLRDEVFPLSRVLELLFEEGLEVVSCASTQVNDSFLHTIKTEVSDTTSIDLLVLRQKLTDVIT